MNANSQCEHPECNERADCATVRGSAAYPYFRVEHCNNHEAWAFNQIVSKLQGVKNERLHDDARCEG
ncbi:hypothetical protein LCGC14_1830330 [marine sediment metagenome]|uniref:Uncharacterized protein n=1 Tax=marine sediment metagenome TaxID=412755 RepID=A0A0F9IVW0_9ZZZZ